MKYFHRTPVAPDPVLSRAADFFGGRLTPLEEGRRHRRFSGVLGQLSLSVQAEGGHYTLITVETNQPGRPPAQAESPAAARSSPAARRSGIGLGLEICMSVPSRGKCLLLPRPAASALPKGQ